MSFVAEERRRHAVWNKGQVIAGHDPTVWRRDDYGNTIKYSDYGLSTQFGWQIDHVVASAIGGSDKFANLRPLHHSLNPSLGGLLGALLREARKRQFGRMR